MGGNQRTCARGATRAALEASAGWNSTGTRLKSGWNWTRIRLEFAAMSFSFCTEPLLQYTACDH